jgi:hypothetical protein
MDSLEDRRTPAKKGIFEVSEESGELDSGEWQQFHTVVAKLLHLAKRAQPDIITMVSFVMYQGEDSESQG